MPQETNLNVSPYFDDFDPSKNYYKVLFKPGYPVQARELTTLQSILQNQIEKFGDHVFKEGSKVIPGQTSYNTQYNAVELENSFTGISLSSYIKSLVGTTIVGESSGIRARVEVALTSTESERGNSTLYVSYISSNSNNNSQTFEDGENLVTENGIQSSNVIFIENESFATTISQNATSVASEFSVQEGVYFLRGTFVSVPSQSIILDQYSNTPSYRIGFNVVEDIITSDVDESLYDNSQGFNNFTSPGADRFKISAILSKKSLTDFDDQNFVEIATVQDGLLRDNPNDSEYNYLTDTLAARTYEESGDYYIKPFTVKCFDSLNDEEGNNGIFKQNQLTYDGNVPSDDLSVYRLSPGKAYVRGYKVETSSPTFLDVEKPRSTKELKNQSINYYTGPSISLNNVSGSPVLGINTSYTISLRDARVENSKNASGSEIGVARVYDFALESGSYSTLYPKTNEWDISLYDVQTFTKISLNQSISLNKSTHVRGRSSGATGFLKNDVSNSKALTLYSTKGSFINGESFSFDGIDNGRISVAVTQYSINDVKSVYGFVSLGGTFNADTAQIPSLDIGEATISERDIITERSIVTIPNLKYSNALKTGNLLSYYNSDNFIIEKADEKGITTTSSNNQIDFFVNHRPGYSDVYINGVKLGDSNYTSIGSSIVRLTNTSYSGDIFELNSFDPSARDRREIVSYEGQNIIPFSTSSSLIKENTIIFLNGIKLNDNQFTVNTASDYIHFNYNLQSNTLLELNEYPVGGKIGLSTITTLTPQSSFSVNYDPENVQVYLNGIKLIKSEYTASNGTSIILGSPTAPQDVLEVVQNGNNVVSTSSTFTSVGLQTSYTVSYNPGYVDVFRNGVKLFPSEYTASNGSSIEFSTPAISGEVIEVVSYQTAIRTGITTTVGSIQSDLSIVNFLDSAEIFANGVKLTKNDYDVYKKNKSYLITSPLTKDDLLDVNHFSEDKFTNLEEVVSSNQDLFYFQYNVGYLDVYINGVKIDKSNFVALNGSTIKFNTPLSAGNVISLYNYSYSAFGGLEESIYDRSFAEITDISTNGGFTVLTVKGVPTSRGICNGTLPKKSITVSNLQYIHTKATKSSDNTLFTPLSRRNISYINLDSSNLTIRKQYNVTVTENSTNTVIAGENETFLSFDEERYILTFLDGTVEPLTSDKFVFGESGKRVTINGVTKNGPARLVTTLRKINVTSKTKENKKCSSIIVSKSSNISSGIGTTTLNDGLEYGKYPYGTRVQDEDISLNVPDVTKLYGVFESYDTTIPSSPKITLGSLTGPNSTTLDLVVGEKIRGTSSGAKGIYLERTNDTVAEFVYANKKSFSVGEKILFEESGIEAIVSQVQIPSKDITKSFVLDNGQRDTYYDYGRIRLISGKESPKRKIKIYFQYGYYELNDDGDITTINSYDSYNFSKEIPYHNNLRNTDIIDIRPRVSPYITSVNKNSPFEFDGRNFSQSGNSAKNILASDESILLDFKFYLPRIDKVFLNKNGIFKVVKGTPAENPNPPLPLDDSIEISTIFLPPYLFNTSNASVSQKSYKRYTMNDISKLEGRITDLEKFTTLSLLETDTSNLFIPDENGINKFKSGFLVDNFKNISNQDVRNGVKNSINPESGEFRPSHYTTSVDLILGSTSIIGVGQSANPNSDLNYVSDFQGSNIKKTGDILSLDYSSIEWLSQPFATRTEKVAPYLVNYWEGTIDLTPESDVWVDTVKVDSKNLNVSGNFTSAIEKIAKIDDYDSQIGFIPTIWESWNIIWTGNSRMMGDNLSKTESKSVYTQFFNNDTGSSSNSDLRWIGLDNANDGNVVETINSNEEKASIQGIKTYEFDSLSIGNKKVSNDIIPYIRSRNVQFVSERLKPYTKMYAFFDGIDVNEFIVPKLIEITMNSGSFIVGETVTGFMPLIDYDNTLSDSNSKISFRCATPNHKFGPYNSPTDTFNTNPYSKELQISSQYSSTSTIINVDTYSLSNEVQGEYYGHIEKGMKLYGETSGAEATVQDVRIITDDTGSVLGSFFIPDPNIDVNPKFTSGDKVFKLTNSDQNSSSTQIISSVSETKYLSVGSIQTIEDDIVSVRSPKTIQKITFKDSDVSSFTGKYLDPLAQTFTVDDETGIFLTGLDIFFQGKDQELPVTCQIRTVDYNVPSNTIIPFTDVTLYPKSVKTSSDASVATHFEFKSPAYLEGKREYAIVLLSNSNEYAVWTSRLGEVDVKSKSGASSSQILVSTQKILGSLFKSQNASNWQPSVFEDLTFKLYRAEFVSNGNISFYNPNLSIGNGQIAKLKTNPLTTSSRKIRVGLSSELVDSNLKIGNSIVQLTTGANGNYVGFLGNVGGLTVTNGGSRYESQTYSNVSLTSLTGNGRDATANISVSNGTVVSVTPVSGGNGYSVGDVLTATLGTNNLGKGLQITVSSISGANQIILDNVQGNFVSGVGNTIYRYSDVGVASTIVNSDGSILYISNQIDVIDDGLHFRVEHKNHGMHSSTNYVSINGVLSDVSPSKSNIVYDKNYDGFITIDNSDEFINFENIPVSGSNPGYIYVNGEIIKYEGVSAGKLINITRGVDNTPKKQINSNDLIYKYELSGVSLRRINKTHRLESSSLSNSIGLDYYNIKIDTSDTNYGTNRGENQITFVPLYFNEVKSVGGQNATATQNIQYEAITPNIQSFVPNFTRIDSRIRTISGRSISGSETSFIDQGFESISMNETNYLSTPRLIASKINEKNLLDTLPGNKSFTMLMDLYSDNNRLSPIIDTTRCSLITTTNRINSAIENYASDPRVNKLFGDPSDCQYVTKVVRLKNPANSLKLYMMAHINVYSDIRAFYSVDNSENSDPVFVPFPGYNNIDADGQIIDPSLNDGLPDQVINKNYVNQTISTDDSYSNYEFTANNLAEFKYFRIKILMTSTNQSYVPKIKNMRVVALA